MISLIIPTFPRHYLLFEKKMVISLFFMFQHDTHLIAGSFANRFGRIIKIESTHIMIPMLKDPSASINDVNEWPACLVVLMACHYMQNVVWEIAMHPTVVAFTSKWPGLCFVILSCSLVTLTRPVTEVWPDLACWNDGWCMLMFYNLSRCIIWQMTVHFL